MKVYGLLAYETLKTFMGPVASAGLRLRIEGEENIPAKGGVLLISNYNSFLDPVSIVCSVGRPIHFMPGPRGLVMPLVRTFYAVAGDLFLLSDLGQRGKETRERSMDLLGEGELVGMFPEGIGPFHNPLRRKGITYFRTECVHIALMAEVPVMPVAVIPGRKADRSPEPLSFETSGSRKRGDEKKARPAIHGTLVRIGRPILLDGYYEEPLTKSLVDSLSGKLRRVVTRLYKGENLERFLTGEEPFDIYTDRV